MPNMPSSSASAGTATTRDGRRLHLERHGRGSPTVVFEAGMGASRNMWGAVVPLVAARTTCVVYDRSGLGQSPPDPAPRTLTRLGDDLLDLLDHVGPGPFVLVGHSWGGPVVRVAAAARPDAVAGLVLVDQTDEHCDLFFSKVNERQAAWAPRILPLLVRTGLMRRMLRRLAASLPEPSRTAFLAEDGTRAAIQAQLAELKTSTDDLRRYRDDPLVLPDMPVTVISGTVTGAMERGRRPELIEAHRATAAALPQGRHVTADASSHYVPFTEPQLVADEILRIIERS
jgi:pimeloyl-ACP methyl ester carboxylesterase